MTSIEQLKEKHLYAINANYNLDHFYFDGEDNCISELNKEDAAKDNANISIQFAIDCLKSVLKDFHNRNNLVEMLNGGKYKSIDNIILDKINEISNRNTNIK